MLVLTPRMLVGDMVAKAAARAMKKAELRLQDLLADSDRQRDCYNRERHGGESLECSFELPAVLAEYRMLLERSALQIVEDPSAQGVREAARMIHHTDAVPLAAVRQAEVGYLVS